MANQWQQIRALAQKGLAPLLSRYTTHLVVVLLVAAAFSLTGIESSGNTNFLDTPTPAPHLGDREFEPVTVRGGGRPTEPANGPLVRSPVLRTTLVEPPSPAAAAPPGEVAVTASVEDLLPTLKGTTSQVRREEAVRREIVTYTVRTGDTLSGIAANFGLAINTLIWSNPAVEAVPDLLKLGQELTILPVDGAYHSVVQGDTLESIATYYKVSVEEITGFELNRIPNGSLPLGLKLVVPGGKKPYVPRVVEHYNGPIPANAQRGSGLFGWPTSGRITCGWLCYPGHYAVDIGNAAGTPVYAADSGYVAKVGWSEVGYGKMVLVDHGNGFQTLYAHLHTILVQEGTSVGKGTLLGRMGDTGNATGPHLHFEIREGGKQRNPVIYLPAE
jgi:murein DD-endopeptidase MepM/ murein hydrolase activator NlpD